MMMGRVMCVLAVVLCCACGYTMAAAITGTGQPKSQFRDLGGWAGVPYATRTEKKQILRKMCKKNSEAVFDKLTCNDVKREDEIFVFNDYEHVKPPKKVDMSTGWYWNAEHKAEREKRDKEQKFREVCKRNPETVTNEVNCTEFLKPKTAEADVRQVNHEEAPSSAAQNSAGGSSSHSDNTRTSKTEVSAPSVTTPTVTSTQVHTQVSTVATHTNQGASSSTTANSTPGNSNTTQQSAAAVDAPATPESRETTSSTPPSSESTISEAPTTTPSPVSVPDTQINNISPTMQNKANVDSSVSPVWMRTAAPLLIVSVLFSFTVY
ncbi:uncharacterized protein TM35_000084430 [Trypanosoma theileri]|uniref:Mucin-like glycoprotein n=1 Tax=Trypanosoma theileri TaxID=67003 RepID=A0A1X0P165_9TRYP|nr:uncharacterized protein TM35_000084430 [Trypanosoma theileri]ORC90645.1 hypothetical protein TM35_000084430 [Trypanosoma theileri]